jgi:catechol 2,3-dioxygenase-like lactoylglutathione lyase family enzyme
MKLTPVLVVDDIERSLPFWVDRMGFKKTVDVPDGDRLAFAILARDGAEVMLQTMESVRKDEPKFAEAAGSRVTALFIEVENFEEIRQQLSGYPIAMAERTTFYGMREVGVFEPSGNIVVFAARIPA